MCKDKHFQIRILALLGLWSISILGAMRDVHADSGLGDGTFQKDSITVSEGLQLIESGNFFNFFPTSARHFTEVMNKLPDVQSGAADSSILKSAQRGLRVALQYEVPWATAMYRFRLFNEDQGISNPVLAALDRLYKTSPTRAACYLQQIYKISFGGKLYASALFELFGTENARAQVVVVDHDAGIEYPLGLRSLIFDRKFRAFYFKVIQKVLAEEVDSVDPGFEPEYLSNSFSKKWILFTLSFLEDDAAAGLKRITSQIIGKRAQMKLAHLKQLSAAQKQTLILVQDQVLLEGALRLKLITFTDIIQNMSAIAERSKKQGLAFEDRGQLTSYAWILSQFLPLSKVADLLVEQQNILSERITINSLSAADYHNAVDLHLALFDQLKDDAQPSWYLLSELGLSHYNQVSNAQGKNQMREELLQMFFEKVSDPMLLRAFFKDQSNVTLSNFYILPTFFQSEKIKQWLPADPDKRVAFLVEMRRLLTDNFERVQELVGNVTSDELEYSLRWLENL